MLHWSGPLQNKLLHLTHSYFTELAENNALSNDISCSTTLAKKYLVFCRQASWMTVTVQRFIKWCPAGSQASIQLWNMPNYKQGASGTKLSSLGIWPTLKTIGYAPKLLVPFKYSILATVSWLYVPWAKLRVIKDSFYFWMADFFIFLSLEKGRIKTINLIYRVPRLVYCLAWDIYYQLTDSVKIIYCRKLPSCYAKNIFSINLLEQ